MVDQSTYLDQSHAYLTQAMRSLRKVTCARRRKRRGARPRIVVKAAEQYGWRHNSHRQVLIAASQSF